MSAFALGAARKKETKLPGLEAKSSCESADMCDSRKLAPFPLFPNSQHAFCTPRLLFSRAQGAKRRERRNLNGAHSVKNLCALALKRNIFGQRREEVHRRYFYTCATSWQILKQNQ